MISLESTWPVSVWSPGVKGEIDSRGGGANFFVSNLASDGLLSREAPPVFKFLCWIWSIFTYFCKIMVNYLKKPAAADLKKISTGNEHFAAKNFAPDDPLT